MELNSSISTLYKLASSGRALQSREFQALGHTNEQSGLRRIAFHGQRSNADRIDALSQRIDKMATMLTRLKQATPALNEAPTVAVESPRQSPSSLSYSVTQDEFGNVTESFSFKVQYKPSGESGFIAVDAPVAPLDSEEVNAKPPAEQVTDSATIIADGDETAAEPLTFDEHIAKLIEYYRIATADGPDDFDPAVNNDKVVEAGAFDQGHHGGEAVDSEIINIDAGYVSRIYSGGGDDVFSINADTVRRVHSQGGDDDISINADGVARIRSGAGDDTLNINTDRAARINTGKGDDIVNINADQVRRIHTGAGDDALSINADTVARINTGAGDDTLTINADAITRVNTGDGDDVLDLTADTIKRVNAGGGDDSITIDANDAAIAFGKGGGNDVINITSVGALAIQIDSALAASKDDYTIATEGNSVKLVFASGESLTVNNVENADMISIRVGGEAVDIHLSEAPVELDMSA